MFNTIFLLIITSVTVSPAKVKAKSEDYTDDYVFGEKDFSVQVIQLMIRI